MSLKRFVNLTRSYSGIERERLGINAPASLPSPTGGLNTRDNQAIMPASDALVMNNAVPDLGSVKSRKGYTVYATGLSSNVETLTEYYSGATRKLIACSGGNVYDATGGGDVSTSTLGTGFTNARWQTVNFRNTLVMINGDDAPQGFDGSTLSDLTISGSGLTVSTLKGVTAHKNRLWWYDGVTSNVWYGLIDTIGGVLTKFELGSVAQLGGNVVSVANWSIDGGDGIDDYIVFFLTSGDLLVYQGTDPSVDFSLVGIYKVNPPISDRSVFELGGDIFFVNKGDSVFFSEIYKNGQVVTNLSKLSGAIKDASVLYSANFGWETMFYPKQGWLITNVPITTNSEYVQYIKNSINGASWKITGWNARTFGIYADDLYFGGDEEILLADNGLIDGTEGIDFKVQQAYTSFNSPMPKTINYYRPVISCDGNVNLSIELFYDFNTLGQIQEVNQESVGTLWDVSFWDISEWSPENSIRIQQYLASGQGRYLSLGIQTTLKNQDFEWFNTDYSLTVNRL